MKRLALAGIICMALPVAPASAASLGGNQALATAALAGVYSPLLSASNKWRLALLFDGHLGGSYPASLSIEVKADSLVCRASNVDIALHTCTLKYGTRTVTLSGRRAHEMFATLFEDGASPDGAAGSIYLSAAHLACTIKPKEVTQQDGSGADCTLDLNAQ